MLDTYLGMFEVITVPQKPLASPLKFSLPLKADQPTKPIFDRRCFFQEVSEGQ